MDGNYAELYRRAKLYLDTRDNDTHTRIAYHYAKQLLEYYPNADEAVVLPAVILHDVGWKMIPEEQQLKAFGPNMRDPNLRRVHEVEGVRIAREILAAVNYDPVKCEGILTIIDGHDSRTTAISLNDQLVKDADKLCRFTQTGIEIDYRRFGIEPNEYMRYLDGKIEGWLFTTEAKEMAREALAKAKAALQSQKGT
jgi:HD superfamily phosphodiesterase